MNKPAILVSMIFVFLLLGANGCEQTEEVVNGLEMSFSSNTPPPIVSTDQEFQIYVDVANKGDSNIDIGKAKFYLYGVGDNFKDVTLELSNKKLLDKDRSERLYFARAAYSPLELNEPYPILLSLKGCYSYSTHTQSKICVAKESGIICSLDGEKITDTSNSHSPIKVTSLKEEVVANKLIITAIIENVGVAKDSMGEVFRRNADCDILQDSTDKGYYDELLKRNEVDVVVNAPGFTCNLDEGNEGVLSLVNNKGRIICDKKVATDNYESIFEVILHYKYQGVITSAITLIKP